jgi:alpha-1,6-mannosyltransferase
VDKRQALSVEALERIQRARPVGLVVLGDGPERARLQQQARGLGHVTFLPFTRNRSEFGAILASADLLLHAATCETFGFVLAEALTSGTPIVVPRAGGAQALAGPEYSETYAADAGPDGVARAVQALLARPRHELSRAAVLAAATLPSLDQHFDDLFAFYHQLRRRPVTEAVAMRQQ